jgi:death-on-curing protein
MVTHLSPWIATQEVGTRITESGESVALPIYLTDDEVKAINQQFLGAPALRDEPALLAALARPLAAAYYQQADLATQTAVLIEDIAQSHPFVDANKRTATAAGLVFLRLNGYTFNISSTRRWMS